MMKYNHFIIDTEDVLAVGDVHGEWKRFVNLYRDKDITNTSFIFLGDIGLLGAETNIMEQNREKNELKYLSQYLLTNNNKAFFIRGNHDNPKYFNDLELNYYNTKFEGIYMVPDYTVITYKDLNILCLGGSISIDRAIRIKEVYYFKNEEFQYNGELLKTIKQDFVIHGILSHGMPSIGRSFDKVNLHYWLYRHYLNVHDIDFNKLDQELNSEVLIEEYYFNEVNNLFKDTLKFWYSGHYHKYNYIYVENIEYIIVPISGTQQIKQNE